MSASERSEVRAFRELETLVRHLGEELAVFRRRAIEAEAKSKDAGSKSAGKRSAPSESDSDLKKRAHQAEQRVRQMLDRVRFLRQQLQATQGSGGRS